MQEIHDIINSDNILSKLVVIKSAAYDRASIYVKDTFIAGVIETKNGIFDYRPGNNPIIVEKLIKNIRAEVDTLIKTALEAPTSNVMFMQTAHESIKNYINTDLFTIGRYTAFDVFTCEVLAFGIIEEFILTYQGVILNNPKGIKQMSEVIALIN